MGNIHRQIETQKAPYDYYEILRQFARLPRSGWKEAKTRLDYCLEAVREGKFRPATRFVWKDPSLGFVFLPLDPKLVEDGNVAELLNRGAFNFTTAHKYEQKLECCVGVAMAKDGEDFLRNWCVMKFPWKHDAELEAKLKESSPFLDVKNQFVPRYHFDEKKEER